MCCSCLCLSTFCSVGTTVPFVATPARFFSAVVYALVWYKSSIPAIDFQWVMNAGIFRRAGACNYCQRGVEPAQMSEQPGSCSTLTPSLIGPINWLVKKNSYIPFHLLISLSADIFSSCYILSKKKLMDATLMVCGLSTLEAPQKNGKFSCSCWQLYRTAAVGSRTWPFAFLWNRVTVLMEWAKFVLYSREYKCASSSNNWIYSWIYSLEEKLNELLHFSRGTVTSSTNGLCSK